MMDIPYEQLSEEALNGILEEFVTRGGYESDIPIASRIATLKERLKKGKAKIVFDPEEGAANLVPL